MMKRKLLPLALMFVSISGVAAEASVTKTATPNSLSRISGKAISMHRVSGTDYPRGSSMSAALVGVSWSATSYPQSIGEFAELCMKRQGEQEDCHSITPGSSGFTQVFNNSLLGYASYIMIKHGQTGGPARSLPAGSNSVTFHLSY